MAFLPLVRRAWRALSACVPAHVLACSAVFATALARRTPLHPSFLLLLLPFLSLFQPLLLLLLLLLLLRLCIKVHLELAIGCARRAVAEKIERTAANL